MTERATPAPAYWPYHEHRTLAQVDAGESATAAANVTRLIWCKHCEIKWHPRAVRACIRHSCPAKVELP